MSFEISPFWNRLEKVSRFVLRAKSLSEKEKERDTEGRGDVIVVKTSDTSLIFQEKGCWEMGFGSTAAFTNTWCWVLNKDERFISLEHLRRGPNAPVFLCRFIPIGLHHLTSVGDHLCGEDAYSAEVAWDKFEIFLNWQVMGPRKNEGIQWCYD